MAIISLKRVRLAFPALFTPQAIGDGNPAYGAKLIIEPGSENAKLLSKTVKEEAKGKWGEKADKILPLLIADKRCAWVEGPYTSSEGDIYDGFDGMYFLSTRSEKLRPTALNRDKSPVTAADGVIYSGCYVDASAEVYAYESKQWGKRINATLRGVRFVSDGAAFGGSTAASAGDFDDLPEEDFV
jgi:hypothetical protein